MVVRNQEMVGICGGERGARGGIRFPGTRVGVSECSGGVSSSWPGAQPSGGNLADGASGVERLQGSRRTMLGRRGSQHVVKARYCGRAARASGVGARS